VATGSPAVVAMSPRVVMMSLPATDRIFSTVTTTASSSPA